MPPVVQCCLPEQRGTHSVEFKLTNTWYISSGNENVTLNVAVCGKRNVPEVAKHPEIL